MQMQDSKYKEVYDNMFLTNKLMRILVKQLSFCKDLENIRNELYVSCFFLIEDAKKKRVREEYLVNYYYKIIEKRALNLFRKDAQQTKLKQKICLEGTDLPADKNQRRSIIERIL